MSKPTTETIMDSVLKLLVTSSGLAIATIAPNTLKSLGGPYSKFLKKMDKRQQHREVKRVLYCMKQQGLISGSYDYGLKITPKGKVKLQNLDIEDLRIPPTQEMGQTVASGFLRYSGTAQARS